MRHWEGQRTGVCTTPVTVIVATWDFDLLIALGLMWVEPTMMGDPDALQSMIEQVCWSLKDRFPRLRDLRTSVAAGHLSIDDRADILKEMKAMYSAGDLPVHRAVRIEPPRNFN